MKQDFFDYEVIVVDDGSTDDTAERIKKYPANLISQTNQGVAATRNAGAEASKGDIVIFLDSDCIVQKDFIKTIINPLENPEIGMTHGCIDIANPENLIATLNFIKAKYVFQDLEYMDFAWGACLAIRKKLFQKIGRFDVSLRFGEDQEMAHRVLTENYKIYLVKEANFLHYFPETLYKHLLRHISTARYVIPITMKSKHFMTQQGTKSEYLKLLIHGLTILTFPLLIYERIPVIIYEEIPFLFSLALSLVSHLRITLYAIKKESRGIFIMFLDFCTRIAWLVGLTIGFVDILMKKTKTLIGLKG